MLSIHKPGDQVLPMRIIVACDGGFLMKALKKEYQTKELAKKIHKWLTTDVPESLARQKGRNSISLFRAYYYDCYPFTGRIFNPFTQKERTIQETSRKTFLEALARMPSMSLRTGELFVNGWRLGSHKRDEMRGKNRMEVEAKDFEPIYAQKGVDIKLTLDALQLLNTRVADAMVFVTGDSDFVPLFEQIRQSGVLVYLVPLGQGVAHSLLASVDGTLEVKAEL